MPASGPDDPRVKAAYKWVQSHYDVESNPGMGAAGLYYYYQAFAKALAAIGSDEIEDADGQKHDWRADLIQALAKRQKPDGSWVNETPLAGRRRQPGDRLCPAHAFLLPAEEIGSASEWH